MEVTEHVFTLMNCNAFTFCIEGMGPDAFRAYDIVV
jgi:hypothetical protein